MKITLVSPVLKTGDTADISNDHPVSVLPCFLKICVMCNRLYKYLIDQKILHPQHVITQLVDQIYKLFENNNYTASIFVHLSKTFDTVNHIILLKKLKIYGTTVANLTWFSSYLTNRK